MIYSVLYIQVEILNVVENVVIVLMINPKVEVEVIHIQPDNNLSDSSM